MQASVDAAAAGFRPDRSDFFIASKKSGIEFIQAGRTSITPGL
jgi:hypothetical protein